MCGDYNNLAEVGFRGRPNYAWLRSVAGDFAYGTNFAASGGSARNATKWKPFNGFNTPFSLNLQLEWLDRYMVHLFDFYLPVTSKPSAISHASTLHVYALNLVLLQKINPKHGYILLHLTLIIIIITIIIILAQMCHKGQPAATHSLPIASTLNWCQKS